MGEQGSILGAEVTVGKRSYNTYVIDVEDHSAVKITKTESGGLIKRHLFSLTIPKVGGGEDIFATIRWSQKLLYDNGQFSVDIPFRFPQYVNPLPKVFMKREKIQLTVNSGVSKEVLLQGSSHPLKEKGRQGEKLSFMHEAVVENWSNKDFTFAYNRIPSEIKNYPWYQRSMQLADMNTPSQNLEEVMAIIQEARIPGDALKLAGQVACLGSLDLDDIDIDQ